MTRCFDPSLVPLGDLLGAVEAIGYRAFVPEEAPPEDSPAKACWRRLLVAAAKEAAPGRSYAAARWSLAPGRS